jgi:hypothetical protein
MSVWISLDSQVAIDRLATDFGGFHDACLREISVATETYVGENLSMTCPGSLDTSALLFLQSQNRALPAIEISCERVTGIRLTPTADGCDSIIMAGEISAHAKGYRVAFNFVGGSLKGPPNGSVLITARSFEEPDLAISAEAISWRPVEHGLGEALRYRKREPK